MPDFRPRGGGWGNGQNGKTLFWGLRVARKISIFVAQIHTNGALIFGKKNLQLLYL